MADDKNVQEDIYLIVSTQDMMEPLRSNVPTFNIVGYTDDLTVLKTFSCQFYSFYKMNKITAETKRSEIKFAQETFRP